MTPNEIRQLSGRELDLAVYEMLHGKEAAAIARKHGGGVAWYHKSLDAAWRLNMEWGWHFAETSKKPGCPSELHTALQLKNDYIMMRVEFADFPTQAEAYATSRARVWLLAMNAQNTSV